MAAFGEAGVQKALHIVGVPRTTLHRKAKDVLNSPADWLLSDEAKEIQLNQEIDLDAADEYAIALKILDIEELN